jgi:hypothetical protein
MVLTSIPTSPTKDSNFSAILDLFETHFFALLDRRCPVLHCTFLLSSSMIRLRAYQCTPIRSTNGCSFTFTLRPRNGQYLKITR